jgi:hypothetical protein
MEWQLYTQRYWMECHSRLYGGSMRNHLGWSSSWDFLGPANLPNALCLEVRGFSTNVLRCPRYREPRLFLPGTAPVILPTYLPTLLPPSSTSVHLHSYPSTMAAPAKSAPRSRLHPRPRDRG